MFSVALHSVGRLAASAVALPFGPRNCGQFVTAFLVWANTEAVSQNPLLNKKAAHRQGRVFLFISFLFRFRARRTMRRRMPLRQQHHLAQIDDIPPIQFQFSNSSAADRRQPNQLSQHFIPCEVFMPDIAARMVKRDLLQANRINPRRLNVFAVIAA
jgi:hypothetical protein